MPVIPTFVSRVTIDAPEQQRVNPAAMAAGWGNVAEGANRASMMLSELAQATRRAQQVAELGNVTNVFMARYADLRGQVENNPDPKQVESLWRAGTAQLVQEITGNISDPAVRQQFQAEATRSIARDQIDIVRLSARRTREAGEAALDGQLSTYAREAAADPRRRAELDTMAEAAIQRNVLAGIIPANEAEKRRERYFGRLDEAEVGQIMLRNPTQALAALSDPARYSAIDPNRRVQLMNAATQAMSARASAGEAAERRAERAHRLAADRAANDLHARIALAERGEGPMPTIADVQAQREWLSPGDFSTIVGRINGVQGRSDPNTRLNLETDVDRMDPATFSASVRRAVDQRLLSADDGANLIRLNRQARRDDQPPSPAVSGRTMVREGLDPGDVFMEGMMRDALTRRQVNAIADFDAWLRQNPNADHDQAIAAARSTLDRYRAAGPGELRNSLPLPFGWRGGRGEITIQTIEQAEVALLRSNLPTQDKAREAGALESWRALLNMMPPQPAPAQQSSGRGQGPRTGATR